MLKITPISVTQTSISDGSAEYIFDNEFLDMFWRVTNLFPETPSLTISSLKHIFTFLDIKKEDENNFYLINMAPAYKDQCEFLDKEQADMCRKNLLILLQK